MTASLWYYRLGNGERGPVAIDELRFLHQSGSISDSTDVRESSSAEWRSFRQAGISRKSGKAVSPTVQRFAPAAEFRNTQAEKPAEQSIQTGGASRSAAPMLPASRTVPDLSKRNAIAGICLGLFFLILMVFLFWPDEVIAPGMAESGAGAGAGTEGADQSPLTPPAAPESENSNTSVSSELTEADGADSDQAVEPVEMNSSVEGSSEAELITATTGAGSADAESSTSDAAPEEMLKNDAPLGIDEDSASANAPGLAVGDDSGDSRFSISAPGETTFFGIRGAGRRFTYVVDCSGSMQGEPLSRAMKELTASIEKLPSHVEFQIIFFDDLVYVYPATGYLKASAASRRSATSFISGVVGGGGTNVKLGIQQAFSDRKKPDTVFLLTDGSFESDTAGFIKSLNKEQKVRINTVAFVTNSGELLLKAIADENRGDYRFVP